MPVPYCLGDCGFVVEPTVRQVDSGGFLTTSNYRETTLSLSPFLPLRVHVCVRVPECVYIPGCLKHLSAQSPRALREIGRLAVGFQSPHPLLGSSTDCFLDLGETQPCPTFRASGDPWLQCPSHPRPPCPQGPPEDNGGLRHYLLSLGARMSSDAICSQRKPLSESFPSKLIWILCQCSSPLIPGDMVQESQWGRETMDTTGPSTYYVSPIHTYLWQSVTYKLGEYPNCQHHYPWALG